MREELLAELEAMTGEEALPLWRERYRGELRQTLPLGASFYLHSHCKGEVLRLLRALRPQRQRVEPRMTIRKKHLMERACPLCRGKVVELYHVHASYRGKEHGSRLTYVCLCPSCDVDCRRSVGLHADQDWQLAGPPVESLVERLSPDAVARLKQEPPESVTVSGEALYSWEEFTERARSGDEFWTYSSPEGTLELARVRTGLPVAYFHLNSQDYWNGWDLQGPRPPTPEYLAMMEVLSSLE